jgi:hypothetical protein
MLNSLLQGIGQRLAKKPFTWMSWWRGKRWSSVFFIVPKLSEERPLWKRDEASLSSLLLFNLEPPALQAEIHAYWRKGFWQRWWLGLFTSINNKIKVWSYYQRCLAFAAVQKQHHDTVSNLQYSVQERAILAELVNWVDENTRRCEERLEKHGGDLNWLQNHFPSVLSQYQKKRERVFLKLMEKRLKEITTKEGRTHLQSRVKEEYQELEQSMRDYLLYPFSSQQARTNNDEATEQLGAVSGSQELVYLGPAELTTRSTTQMSARGENLADIDLDSAGDWVRLQRQTIDSFLAAKTPEAYTEIKALLEQSLSSIKRLIDSQIEAYKQVIRELRNRNIDYKEAIVRSENIHPPLMSFFRSSVLLFHPDKSNGNEDLGRIQTEFFPQFRQLSEASRETLKEGLEILKCYVPLSEAEIQKILDERERDRKAFRAELAQIGKEIAQMRKEREEYAQERERDARERQEAEAKQAQEKAEMEAKIEELKRLVHAQNRHQPSAETAPQDQERPGSSTRSFARR